MGKNSRIEWTDHTFNPWWGCVKVSDGCRNCYAEARQYGGDWWGIDKPRRFFGKKHWNQPKLWNADAKEEGIRYRVFCGSYCDVFEDRHDLMGKRIDLFMLILYTPHLDWLLLTKRPENVLRFIPSERWKGLDNIWLGVSVENQEMANKRIPLLRKIPAKIRFVSCEPLLEPVDFLQVGYVETEQRGDSWPFPVDWVIVGGESGKYRRPFNPDWARSIRDRCQKADIPFFMKQIDKVQPIPDDLMIREFPGL